ncbi:MAG TPA: hypothetical protein VII92_08125 [Anaerolineae bacterium]
MRGIDKSIVQKIAMDYRVVNGDKILFSVIERWQRDHKHDPQSYRVTEASRKRIARMDIARVMGVR